MARTRLAEIELVFARSLSPWEARLVQLYYADDASFQTVEAELDISYSGALEAWIRSAK